MKPRLLLALVLTACAAPPPTRTPEELRRPISDARRYDAVILDNGGARHRLADVRLRGAAAVLETDEWRFVELAVPGQEQPIALAFSDIVRLRVDGVVARRLQVTVLQKSGALTTGALKRGTFLDGHIDFGAATILLRDLRELSFAERTTP